MKAITALRRNAQNAGPVVKTCRFQVELFDTACFATNVYKCINMYKCIFYIELISAIILKPPTVRFLRRQAPFRAELQSLQAAAEARLKVRTPDRISWCFNTCFEFHYMTSSNLIVLDMASLSFFTTRNRIDTVTICNYRVQTHHPFFCGLRCSVGLEKHPKKQDLWSRLSSEL